MCVYDVDREWYASQVDAVSLFLGGKNDELVETLQTSMSTAATGLDYERAAMYRDQLRAVERSLEGQRVVSIKKDDEDVWGLHREADLVEIVVLRVRRGRVVEERTFSFDGVEIPDAEALRSVLSQFYAREDPPDTVLVSHEIEVADAELLAALWGERKGRGVALRRPRRGHSAELVALAVQNAGHAFGQKRRSQKSMEDRLAEVQRRLGLAKLPRRIECVDISHLGGTDTVASLVSLWNGEIDRSRTKTFHVRTVSDGDDYGAMREVLSRRFRRVKDGDEAPGWEPPDLLVVDGGRGQLAVAVAVLEELRVEGVDVSSLAKERESPRFDARASAPPHGPADRRQDTAKGPRDARSAHALSEKLVDRAYLPGRKNPVFLRPNSSALFLLARIRDEAHRVAVGFQSRVRRRKRLRSGLLDVPGVGPKTAKALLVALGSLKRVKAATLEELSSVKGVTRAQAEAVYTHLRNEPASPPEAGS
jgi:excinuclease ABC subunit C